MSSAARGAHGASDFNPLAPDGSYSLLLSSAADRAVALQLCQVGGLVGRVVGVPKVHAYRGGPKHCCRNIPTTWIQAAMLAGKADIDMLHCQERGP